MMKKTLTIFFCLLSFTAPARADVDEFQGDHVAARLISAYEGVGDRPAIDLGLALALEKDWYTYWRMPGENGLAPSFDWSNSENVKDVTISFPAPERFTTFDMHSFGYDDDILFPLSVTPQEIGKQIRLDLLLNIVICHDICIPATLHVSKTVDGDDALRTREYDVIKRARDALPAKENTKRLGIDTAVLSKNAIVVTAYAKGGFKNTDLIVEATGTTITSPPEIIPDPSDRDRAVLKITAPQGMDFSKALFGTPATITLINGREAVEKTFTF